MLHRGAHLLPALTIALALATPALVTAQPASISVTVTMPPQEGNGGSNLATFQISQADSVRTVFLLVSTEPVTATGGSSCGGNADFINTTNVGVTLVQRTPVNFTVPLCGDTRDEPNETFNIRIAQTNGSQVTPNLVTATIVDDDPTPTLRVADVQINEPPVGGGATATFSVSLSASSGQPVTFTYQTTAALAGQPATGGVCGSGAVDFTAIAPTQMTVSAGLPSASVTVSVCGDGVHEGTEHLRLQLSAATNATFADDAGVLTIVDREPPPTIAIEPTVRFGAATPLSSIMGGATFVITLAGPPTERPVTVNYTTADGTAVGSNTCVDVNLGGIVRRAGDYISKSSNSFTIRSPSTPITVNYCKLRSGAGKTFTLRLDQIQNASPISVSRIATFP